MGHRDYVLLDTAVGKAEQVAQVLRESLCMARANVPEDPPHVAMVKEAVERQQLAKLTIRALALVRTMTEHAHLLLEVRDGLNTVTCPRLSSQTRSKNGRSRQRER